LHSRDQPQALQNEQEKFYKDPKIPTCLSFLNIQRMQQSMTLAASSTYEIVMSAAITASNCITYYEPLNYDLLDASGASLIGYTRKGTTEQLYEYASCFDNKFRDFTLGQNNGYMPLTTYEKLSFTTGSGLATAAYTIDIWAYVQDELRIKDGKGHSLKA